MHFQNQSFMRDLIKGFSKVQNHNISIFPLYQYNLSLISIQPVTLSRNSKRLVKHDRPLRKPCCESVIKWLSSRWRIKRNFQDKSKETVMPLYKSLVRPHWEYWCQVWSPYLSKDINLVQGVQRRGTKLIKDIKHLSYDERLENLGLSSLTTRRVTSDLIQSFKIINGIDKVDKSLFFESDSGGRRGHSSKLFKKM